LDEVGDALAGFESSIEGLDDERLDLSERLRSTLHAASNRHLDRAAEIAQALADGADAGLFVLEQHEGLKATRLPTEPTGLGRTSPRVFTPDEA
jgi:hypothetical protein